jgi:hypothetical protein
MRPLYSCKCVVLVPVENIKVRPQQYTHYVGDVINCSADGYPVPTYVWTELSNKITSVNGSSLTINESMIGSSYTFQCMASNFINDNNYTKESIISFIVVSGYFILFFVLLEALTQKTVCQTSVREM